MPQPSKDRSQSQVVELLSHFLKYTFLHVLPNSSLFWESILESREKKNRLSYPCKTFQKHDSFRSIAAASSPPSQDSSGIHQHPWIRLASLDQTSILGLDLHPWIRLFIFSIGDQTRILGLDLLPWIRLASLDQTYILGLDQHPWIRLASLDQTLYFQHRGIRLASLDQTCTRGLDQHPWIRLASLDQTSVLGLDLHPWIRLYIFSIGGDDDHDDDDS